MNAFIFNFRILIMSSIGKSSAAAAGAYGGRSPQSDIQGNPPVPGSPTLRDYFDALQSRTSVFSYRDRDDKECEDWCFPQESRAHALVVTHFLKKECGLTEEGGDPKKLNRNATTDELELTLSLDEDEDKKAPFEDDNASDRQKRIKAFNLSKELKTSALDQIESSDLPSKNTYPGLINLQSALKSYGLYWGTQAEIDEAEQSEDPLALREPSDPIQILRRTLPEHQHKLGYMAHSIKHLKDSQNPLLHTPDARYLISRLEQVQELAEQIFTGH